MYKIKHNILILLLIFILSNCQLNSVKKNHGINFLEQKTKKIKINESNKNDIVKIFGSPSSIDTFNDENWIYLERIITRGKLLKMGRNVINQNNVLLVEFNDIGIVKNYEYIDKSKLNKIKFSKDETDNNINRKNLIYSFLSSMRQKINNPSKKKLKK
tara:strand:- start:198 stop:671 length:474 start_codon:yes stop_codon:yes gene_type:complete